MASIVRSESGSAHAPSRLPAWAVDGGLTSEVVVEDEGARRSTWRRPTAATTQSGEIAAPRAPHHFDLSRRLFAVVVAEALEDECPGLVADGAVHSLVADELSCTVVTVGHEGVRDR